MAAAKSLPELIALSPSISHRVLRAVSVEADACMQSVTSVVRGKPTRRSTRDRITAALVKLGLVARGVDLTPPPRPACPSPPAPAPIA